MGYFMLKEFDKKFIEFPLFCLLYCANDKKRLKDIILYCIVDSAIKSKIDDKIDCSLVKPDDFDNDNEIYVKIAAAAVEYNYKIESIEKAINVWLEIKPQIVAYEGKYGTDAYCRMGMQLTNDVITGRFGFREYKVLAAIQSTLGKKRTHLRITYENISYRALGYKMKKIAYAEGITQGALSGRQIKTSVIKLINKKLLTSVTYFKREKYYSTVIKCPEKLRELIKNKKQHNHQVSCGIEDFRWSLKTKEEMESMRMRG